MMSSVPGSKTFMMVISDGLLELGVSFNWLVFFVIVYIECNGGFPFRAI